MNADDQLTPSESIAIARDEEIAPAVKLRGVRRFSQNIGAVVSVVYLVILTILCFFPALVTPYPQNDINLDRRLIKPGEEFWFGTDRLGRDLLSEVLHGGQVSLRIGLMVALISTLVGVTLGSLAGYKGGWSDSLIMRSTDLFLVVPQIVILSIGLKKYGANGEAVVALIVSLTFWMSTARYVRAQVMVLKTHEYVDAARSFGHSSPYIIVRHLIPNSWNIIAVSSALAVANAILIESTVSFLGFGVQPPSVSWGLLLDNAKGSILGDNFYLFFIPGLAIFLTVLAFNFISDGLRDAFDPRSEQS